jgi:peptide/nickel transport system permease protein
VSRYLIRRLLIAVPSLLGISVVLFTILALAPGDPFSELATNPAIPPEVQAALRAKFGLDDPIPIRYLHWLAAMLHGDWGFSFVSRVNVDTLILQRLPTTLAVIGASQLLALLVALPVGVLAAVRPYSTFDQVVSTFALMGFSLPTFFTGIILILVFSIQLDWLPFVFRADLPGRGLDALRALRRARRDPPGIRDHRTFQGSAGTRRDPEAYRTQRADPSGDTGRLADAGGIRRRHRHRADLPGAGHWFTADQCDPVQ